MSRALLGGEPPAIMGGEILPGVESEDGAWEELLGSSDPIACELLGAVPPRQAPNQGGAAALGSEQACCAMQSLFAGAPPKDTSRSANTATPGEAAFPPPVEPRRGGGFIHGPDGPAFRGAAGRGVRRQRQLPSPAMSGGPPGAGCGAGRWRLPAR
ncbi:UNVERIFIED_CONTAM: hypothetical protein K2H54_035884 [Gekko kuhli]